MPREYPSALPLARFLTFSPADMLGLGGVCVAVSVRSVAERYLPASSHNIHGDISTRNPLRV